MLDNAVKIAKDFAAKRNDTLIVVVADHAHPVSIVGSYDDERKGDGARDKLGVYNEAKFPNYPPADADGYPPSVDVSRRLAFVFGAFPDHCDTVHPHLDGPNVPAVKGEDGRYIANEKNCAARRRPCAAPAICRPIRPQDVHRRRRCGADRDRTGRRAVPWPDRQYRVFRFMANALGLASR